MIVLSLLGIAAAIGIETQARILHRRSMIDTKIVKQPDGFVRG